MKSNRFCDARLLFGQVVCPGHNNTLQLCLQTYSVRIRHSWFRSRCQRPQLSHNKAIRPSHCSQSHFAPARLPCLKIMSQRIKASWLTLGETRRGQWYSALNFHFHFFFFLILFCGNCLLLMLFIWLPLCGLLRSDCQLQILCQHHCEHVCCILATGDKVLKM